MELPKRRMEIPLRLKPKMDGMMSAQMREDKHHLANGSLDQKFIRKHEKLAAH